MKRQQKWLTTYESSGAFTTSGSIISLTQIPLGTNANSRIGSVVRMTQVEWKAQFGVGDTWNTCRMMIFVWNPDSAAEAPTMAQVLDASGPTANPSVWLPRMDTKRKYAIIYDETFMLVDMPVYNGSTVVHQGYGSSSSFAFKKGARNLGGRKMEFNAATTGMGQLFLLFVADSAITPNPYVYGQFRVQFEDVDGL